MANDIKQIGVEIVATDKASGAFDSVNKSVDNLTESLKENDKQVKENAKSRAQSAEQNKRSVREEVSAQKAAATAAKEAAAEQEKLERSYTRRLQRQKEALILQDEGNVALLKSKGITNETLLSEAAALDAVIAKRREAAAVFTQSGKQLNEFGQTARQTAAALRQVPAQFTDIIVSLQGGQAPLTVLLQQGGQLKDVFGGVGNAAKAMSGYVLGLINPFTIAAATIAAVGLAYKKGSEEADAFAKSLILTGNAAGTTAAELGRMSENVGRTVGGQAKAAEFMNLLVQSGNVASGNFERLTASALAFSEAGGGAIEDIAKKFSDLGKAPVETSLELTKSARYLTAATYEQIKALSDQGRETEAAKLAQEAYAKALDDATPQMLARLGLVEKGWNLIKSAGVAAINGLLSVGRDSALADIENELSNAYATGASAAEIASLEARYQRIKTIYDKEKEIAEVKRQGNVAEEQKIAFLKEQDKYLTNQQKFDKEKTRIQNAYNEALKNGLITQREIDGLIEKARKSILGKDDAKDLREQEKAAKDLAATFASLAGLTSTYYAELAKYQEQRASGVITEEQYVRAVELLIQKQPFVIKQAKDLSDALKEQTKVWEAYGKEVAKAQAERDKDTAKLQKTLDDRRLELASIGLTKAAVAELAAAQRERAAATLEAHAAELIDAGDMDAAEEYLNQARIIRETANVERQIGIKKDAKAAADEWKKTAEKIENSLTDALMRGFESGKGFVQTLRDTIVNAFKTMVLRPTIQAVVAGTGATLGFDAKASTPGGGIGGLSQGMGWLTDFGGSTSFAADALGEFLVKNTSGALNEFGGALMENAAAIGDYASTLGSAVGYLQAASYLFGDTKDYGAGAGAAIGTYYGGPIGSYIGAELGKMLGLTDTSGTYHMGGAAGYSAAGGLVGQAAAAQQLEFDVDTNEATQKMVEGLSQGLAALFDSTAAIFGEKAGYYAATAFADDTSKDGAWGALMVKLGDQMLIDWGKGTDKWPGREFADGEAGAKAYLSAVAADVRDVLREAAPQWAQSMLDGLGEAPTLDALISTAKEIGRVQNTLVAMGKIMPQLADLSGEAASALLAMSGGIDNLNKLTGSYYQNFYSEAERTAKTAELLTGSFSNLGLALPESRQAFRELVDAQDLTTMAGRATYVALMSVADAFASITPLGDAVSDSLVSISRVMEDLISERESLQRELLVVQKGDVRAFDIKGMNEAEIALYDYNQALRDQIEAASKATTSSKARSGTSIQDTVAKELISGIESFVSYVGREIDSLYASVASTKKVQAEAGKQFIDEALATFRATGYLPDQKALAEAVAAARTGLDPAQFRTSAEADKAALVMAGKLAELKAGAEDQLNIAQTQLNVLVDIGNNVRAFTKATDRLNDQIRNAYVRERRDTVSVSVDVPMLATGTNYVPQDMLAVIHKGEAVVPKEYNPSVHTMTGDRTGTMLGGKGVVEEIRAMRADSRAQAKAVVQLQSRFTKLMERWDTNGMPEVRAVA